MTQEEIKQECELSYSLIKQAKDTLLSLRSICEHPIIVVGNYSWRLGSIVKANICSDCGKVVTTNVPKIQ